MIRMNSLRFVQVLAIGSAVSLSASVLADADGDGIPDDVEHAVLNAIAPIWYPEAVRRLQPIDWMVKHGFVKVYRRTDNVQVGRVPATNLELTPDQMLAEISAAETVWPRDQYHYRWAYFDGHTGRNTIDPNDPFDWNIAQSTGRGVYGRVEHHPSISGLLLVQYFVHFGWNETSADCDVGNHEGDWICVDFDVDATDPNQPRIVRAIYHNHGRQVFVQCGDTLKKTNQHPHVYLEQGTQETWPHEGDWGFIPPSPFNPEPMPACISTNKELGFDTVIFGVCSLEYDDCLPFASVRSHRGVDGGFLVAPKNIGSGGPMDDPEARFIYNYFGQYGSEWIIAADECGPFGELVDWVSGFVAESPFGPPYQPKMWNRLFDQNLDWTSWTNQPTVWASPNGGQHPDGSMTNPCRTLNGALGLIAEGGTVNLGAGQYADVPMTVRNEVTITANGGSATIGN